jgi:hypothetical protein
VARAFLAQVASKIRDPPLRRNPRREPAKRLTQELGSKTQQMIARLAELRSAQNAPSVFRNQFWRDFYQSLSDGISRTALVKVASVALLLALAAVPHSHAAEGANVVIALDLTNC